MLSTVSVCSSLDGKLMKLIADFYETAQSDLHEQTTSIVFSSNCPNCGAPLPIVGSKICHYCGTGIKSSAGLGWILTDVAMD